MATEQLRLEATFQDNMSAAMARCKKAMDEFRQTPSMAGVNAWFTKAAEGAESFAAKGFQAASVFNTLGIGSLTASASLAGLVLQFRELGQRSLEIKELGRQTGLTIDQVNAFTHAGAAFNVSSAAMSSGLAHFFGQMPEYQRKMGALYLQMTPFKDTLNDLMNHGPAQQLEDVFKFLGQPALMKEPQLQKQWAQLFFGNGDEMEKLMARGTKGVLDELALQTRELGKINPEVLAQAEALRKAQIEFNTSLERFETNIAPGFLKGMRLILDLTNHVVENLDHIAHPFRDAPNTKEQAHDDMIKGRKQFDDDMTKAGQGAWDWIKSLFHKSSFQDENGFGSSGLVHPAALSTNGGVDIIADGTKAGFLAAFRELMADRGGGAAGSDMSSGGAGILKASLGGGGLRGGGSSDLLNGPVSNDLFGAIMKAEGTNNKDPYNTVLGNGRYGLPPKPLTDMTLAEAYAFGRTVRARHGSSSALGAFQIVGKTMMDHARALGLDPSTTRFDPATQRRLAEHIARTQGLGAWEGFKSHPHELDAARRALSGAGTFGLGPKGATVDPVLQALVKRANEIAGVNASIYSGLRSPEHNRAVGGAQNSLHMRGLAADLSVPGHAKGDRAFWEGYNQAFGQAAREYGQPYRWGGTFGGRYRNDNDHFDLTPDGASDLARRRATGLNVGGSGSGNQTQKFEHSIDLRVKGMRQGDIEARSSSGMVTMSFDNEWPMAHSIDV